MKFPPITAQSGGFFGFLDEIGESVGDTIKSGVDLLGEQALVKQFGPAAASAPETIPDQSQVRKDSALSGNSDARGIGNFFAENKMLVIGGGIAVALLVFVALRK